MNENKSPEVPSRVCFLKPPPSKEKARSVSIFGRSSLGRGPLMFGAVTSIDQGGWPLDGGLFSVCFCTNLYQKFGGSAHVHVAVRKKWLQKDSKQPKITQFGAVFGPEWRFGGQQVGFTLRLIWQGARKLKFSALMHRQLEKQVTFSNQAWVSQIMRHICREHVKKHFLHAHFGVELSISDT